MNQLQNRPGLDTLEYLHGTKEIITIYKAEVQYL